MIWFRIASVIFGGSKTKARLHFTVKAVNYRAPVWKLGHTPGSCLIWVPGPEWALVSSWGWWKLLILRTGHRIRAWPCCYQRDPNDLCLVKKQHSLPLHQLPLIFLCSANTWLSRGILFYGKILFIAFRRRKRGPKEGIGYLTSMLRITLLSIKEVP